MVEFDIRGLFDNLDHDLLMAALRKHCQEPWILLYVERWLKAPMQSAEGQLQKHDKGTPRTAGRSCRRNPMRPRAGEIRCLTQRAVFAPRHVAGNLRKRRPSRQQVR